MIRSSEEFMHCYQYSSYLHWPLVKQYNNIKLSTGGIHAVTGESMMISLLISMIRVRSFAILRTMQLNNYAIAVALGVQVLCALSLSGLCSCAMTTMKAMKILLSLEWYWYKDATIIMIIQGAWHGYIVWRGYQQSFGIFVTDSSISKYSIHQCEVYRDTL